MIAAAIRNLENKYGSSKKAIKKYIVANYNIDVGKCGEYLDTALKAEFEKGNLKYANHAGKGARSFVLTKAKKLATKKATAKKASKK